MPPTLHLVRHAQGYHNATRNYSLPDPILTPEGKSQCKKLSETFRYHKDIDLILCSPLRRTIQTAVLSFGEVLARQEVPFVLVPALQEVSDAGSDTGSALADLKQGLPALLAESNFDISMDKVDMSAVHDGWNLKNGGYYAYTKEAILKRAADLRTWLFQQPQNHILIVTHGGFLHFLTEDWDVDDPMTGTAYKNCETRQFVFTPESTPEDAHLVETLESRRAKDSTEKELDPHVLDELEAVVHGHSKN